MNVNLETNVLQPARQTYKIKNKFFLVCKQFHVRIAYSAGTVYEAINVTELLHGCNCVSQTRLRDQSGRAIVRVVSRQPLTAESRVCAWVNQCGICC
jgi:hypothetical protein